MKIFIIIESKHNLHLDIKVYYNTNKIKTSHFTLKLFKRFLFYPCYQKSKKFETIIYYYLLLNMPH